ncbi:hypothetical protein P7K49_030808 [Saguinus oedipus]|uniref:Prohibitin n=1 Tax=Saguinus oedipus TaxID=9490 RepID=A0ABQ9U437_SAGOE|nr:hypothetical protein P7K49_030808 [Saguinus oedipus]
MAAKVFESIGKFGLALAVAGGVVNSALCNQDLQNVKITLCILFQPIASQLPRIFTSTGEDYDERVLPSIMTEIVKSRAATFGLILDDILLTHLTFRKEFTEVVEAVAQQEAGRARFVVEKAEQQKKAAIISAEGNSIAAELTANSLATAGDGLIELHKLETVEDIVYQLSCSRNITHLPVGQSMLLQLPQGEPTLQAN